MLHWNSYQESLKRFETTVVEKKFSVLAAKMQKYSEQIGLKKHNLLEAILFDGTLSSELTNPQYSFTLSKLLENPEEYKEKYPSGRFGDSH